MRWRGDRLLIDGKTSRCRDLATLPPRPSVQPCATNVTQSWSEGGIRIIGYEQVSDSAAGRQRSWTGSPAPGDRGIRHPAGRDRSIARFTEVESGGNADRPQLKQAAHLAKVTGATLVIAKLDRLSRNAAFLLTLKDSGVRFSTVHLPEANDLPVGIMARGGAAGARGDLQADQGGAECGQEPRGEARQPQRGSSTPAGWQGRRAPARGHRLRSQVLRIRAGGAGTSRR